MADEHVAHCDECTVATDDEVREYFAAAWSANVLTGRDEARARFDRWLSARLAQTKAEALREFADAHRFLPEWVMFRRNDDSAVTIPDLLRETANRIESEAGR